MKTNLAIILWKKEKVHWRRMGKVFGEYNWIGKILIALPLVIILSLFHYAFAIMHTLFELFLFVFFKNAFRANLQQLALKV